MDIVDELRKDAADLRGLGLPREDGWAPLSERAASEIGRLRNLLAAYVADEDRWNAGKGEPYGSISTETGMLARAVVKQG
jgi:hypothetical protein